LDASARPHHRLIWKYTAVVVALVAAAIVSVGIIESYFTYQDSKLAVSQAEADKASSAALSIDQFIAEILADLRSVSQPSVVPGSGERLQSFKNLLAHQKNISQLTYLDASGRECVRAYSFEIDQLNSQTCGNDLSGSEGFSRARTEPQFFGSVTFDESA